MAPVDLDRIESDLAIRLPRVYRDRISPFPITALRGNSEWMLWDDADALITLNLNLRERCWPERFYALGEDDSGSSDALDLEDPEAGVFWFDRQQIDVGPTDRSDVKFEQWIEQQIEYIRHDLRADEIDPDAEPNTQSTGKRSFLAKLFDWFLLFAAALVIVAGYALIRGYLSER